MCRFKSIKVKFEEKKNAQRVRERDEIKTMRLTENRHRYSQLPFFLLEKDLNDSNKKKLIHF